MSNPEDRAKYREYKKERDKVTVINLNKWKKVNNG
jgi:hypothetical protein